MNGRVKIQVWSATKQRWRTAYCTRALLLQNLQLMKAFGIPMRAPCEDKA